MAIVKLEQSCNVQIVVAGFGLSVQVTAECPLDLYTAVEPVADSHDTYLVRLVAERSDGEPFILRDLSIRWKVPAVDMHGFYSGTPSPEELAKLPYWQVRKRACANIGLPFVALFHRGGENRAAFGLLDQLTETALDAELSEATRCYHFCWHKPIGHAPLTTDRWEETFFVSTARCPWPEVLRTYVETVDREWHQPKMPVPEHAFDPVFCTWTAIHHDVSQEWVLRNARHAHDLGFGTWLTDDGWFTDKATFADYRYAGDWEPCDAKFPDFAGHVRAVQEMGLRYVLWVAPFMVGKASQAAQRYAHLLTGAIPERYFSNLSPWQRETRDIVADLLERLVRDYHLDGLKLDFIGRIPLDCETTPDAAYRTLGEGIYGILSYACDRLAALKPGLLIEFRNPYANLASRRYANLYRAYDVPINFAMNRWQIVMLRLLAPDRAVHLDPALWHPDDSDENVAVHLINAIISVPMISIELDQYPRSHLDLIRYWIGFYRAHRDTIVHGEFGPEFHLGRVPLIRFTGERERIIGLYDDSAFPPGAGAIPLWVLNASTRPFVELLPDGFTGPYTVTTRDKFGHIVAQGTVQFPISCLAVEIGGSLEIEPVLAE